MTHQPTPEQRKKLMRWLGCAMLLLFALLIAVGATMMRMLRHGTAEPANRRMAMPAGWRDRLHRQRDLPAEVGLLVPERTGDGNAAREMRMAPVSPYHQAYLRLVRGQPLRPEEQGALGASLRDTVLDRVARAATLRRYSAVPLYLAGSALADRLFGVAIKSTWVGPVTTNAVEALIVRAAAQARAGHTDLAARDERAAIGLGLMMFEREPSWSGSNIGLRMAGEAATALAALAGRDTATAGAAVRLRDWASRTQAESYQVWIPLFAMPDSGLATVGDTRMPFPVRAEAVHAAALGSIMQGPWSVFRGPTRATFRIVRAAERDADSDLAALAVATDSTLERLDRVGGWKRLQMLLHPQR